MEILVYPPGGNSGFRNEFYWIAVNIKPFPLYSSLPPVISEEFINSQSKGVYAQPWFGFLFPCKHNLNTQGNNRVKKCIIHSCCPYFHTMKGLFFLCQSIKDNWGCSYITALENRLIWHTGNRTGLILLDARDLYDQLAHERCQSAPLLLSQSRDKDLQCLKHNRGTGATNLKLSPQKPTSICSH